MASTNIDIVLKKIEEDFVELSKKAAKSAAKKAQTDIEQKADKFIDEYYEFEPKLYKKKRQMALYKLVEEYYKEKESGKGITIEFGVLYNPVNIKGLHRSMSRFHQSGRKWIPRASFTSNNLNSSANGIPEPEWITEKFLAGEHPWTDTDAQSPDDKMQDFFDTELDSMVIGYLHSALMDAVAAYF